MGFRQYDFECRHCGHVRGELVWTERGKKPPAAACMVCPECLCEDDNDRRISCPARYTYDRPYAPQVYGGKFDTMGQRHSGIELPDLPRDASFDQARDVLMSKERREKVEANLAVQRENKLKRQRAKAMRK